MICLHLNFILTDIHCNFNYVMDVKKCKPARNVSRKNHALRTSSVNPHVHIRQKEKITAETAEKNDETCDTIVKKAKRQDKRGNKIINID